MVSGATVTSDGGFEVLRKIGFTHKVAISPKGKAGCDIEPFKWVNRVPHLAVALMRAKPCPRKAIQMTAEVGT